MVLIDGFTERDKGPSSSPVMIIGASGIVGAGLAEGLANIKAYSGRKELDVLNKEQVVRAVGEFPGRVIVNASGNVEVSRAENHPEVTTVNRVGVEYLIDACRQAGKTLVHFSSETIRPYWETGPLLESYFPMRPPEGAYARSKWEAERAVRNSDVDYVIVRIAYLSRFGKGFLERLRICDEVFYDQLITPTWVPDLARLVERIGNRRDLIGQTLNVASPTAVTPAQLREMLDKEFKVKTKYKLGRLGDKIANHAIKPARLLDARLSVVESQKITGEIFTPVAEQVRLFATAAIS